MNFYTLQADQFIEGCYLLFKSLNLIEDARLNASEARLLWAESRLVIFCVLVKLIHSVRVRSVLFVGFCAM